jgi:hypothetical protein
VDTLQHDDPGDRLLLVGGRMSEFYDLFGPIVPVELECGRDDEVPVPDPELQKIPPLDPYQQARPYQESGHLADDVAHGERH